MALNFEYGSSDNPRGHAIVYMTDSDGSNRPLATYVVLLPVSVDIQKYVPPFLAGQVAAMNASDLSAFAIPPAPEHVESKEWLRWTAEQRADDLINAGVASTKDLAVCMARVNEIVREYAGLFESRKTQLPQQEGRQSAESGPVEDVIYGLMAEADLLAELTTLTGRLRFAAEGGDAAAKSDAHAKILAIARQLPENRRVTRIAQVAVSPSSSSAELAHLSIDRAYCLCREDYLRVKVLDQQIAELEKSQA